MNDEAKATQSYLKQGGAQKIALLNKTRQHEFKILQNKIYNWYVILENSYYIIHINNRLMNDVKDNKHKMTL